MVLKKRYLLYYPHSGHEVFTSFQGLNVHWTPNFENILTVILYQKHQRCWKEECCCTKNVKLIHNSPFLHPRRMKYSRRTKPKKKERKALLWWSVFEFAIASNKENPFLPMSLSVQRSRFRAEHTINAFRGR